MEEEFKLVKDVVALIQLFRNMDCTYVDNALEKLQMRWDLKRRGE